MARVNFSVLLFSLSAYISKTPKISPPMTAHTIDEVIAFLDDIIVSSIKNENRLGYFAALYKMVTLRVRNEVNKPNGTSIFQDPKRMEKLDVIFANRYLKAYSQFSNGETPTKSWQIAFEAASNPSNVVIQQLFLGMNAHINLDLGVAAAEISQELDQPIKDLHHDFDKINDVLKSLIGQVEKEISMIWPALRWLLRLVPFHLDRGIVSFSMDIARDRAWTFATEIFASPPQDIPTLIDTRDQKVSAYAQDLANPPWWIRLIIFFIHLGENKSVAKNIKYLDAEIRRRVIL